MKKLILLVCLSASVLLSASDMFIIYDAAHIWASASNPVPGILTNPSFSGLAMNTLNARVTQFTGIFPGAGVFSGILSGKYGRMSFFLDFASFSNPAFDIYNDLGEFDYEFEVPGNTKFGLGFTYQAMEKLFLGVQYTNYANNVVYMNGTEVAATEDSLSFLTAGLNYGISGFLLGLSMKNIKLGVSSETENAYSEFDSINFSASKKFLNDALCAGLFISQINQRAGDGLTLGLTVEYQVKFAYIRAGYLYIQNHLSMPVMAGIGIKYKGVDIDYAFDPGETGGQHYISLGYGYSLPNLTPDVIVKKEKGPKVPKPPRIKKPKPKKEVTVKKEPVKKEKPIEKILVAVLDFTAQNMPAEEAVIITDFVRHEMINTDYFKVLERGAINNILKEVNFQQGGCTDAECAVSIGKILSVHKMVVGSVSKLGKKYFVTSRLVDVETSEIEASVSIEAGVPIEDLPKHVVRLVEEMVYRLK